MVLCCELAGAGWLLAGPNEATNRFESGTDRASAATPGVGSVGSSSADTTRVLAGGRILHLSDLGVAGATRLASDINSVMDTAVAAVQQFWGPDWPHDIVVVMTASAEQFSAEAAEGDPAQWSGIAAVTVADQVDAHHRVAVNPRIVLAPGAAAMPVQSLRLVLTHELFHYASRAYTAQDAPVWLAEGVADFVARAPTPIPVDARIQAQDFPVDADLEAPGPQRAQAYDRAWWFARFVAETYGTPALRDLYLAACGDGHPDFPTAAHRVLGVDVLTAWRTWLSA